jgi:hypothetical protein
MGQDQLMIPVAFTWYPPAEAEKTIHTEMPQVPAVGDSVALDDVALPIMRVSHVRWVEEHLNTGGKRWIAEIDLGP